MKKHMKISDECIVVLSVIILVMLAGCSGEESNNKPTVYNLTILTGLPCEHSQECHETGYYDFLELPKGNHTEECITEGSVAYNTCKVKIESETRIPFDLVPFSYYNIPNDCNNNTECVRIFDRNTYEKFDADIGQKTSLCISNKCYLRYDSYFDDYKFSYKIDMNNERYIAKCTLNPPFNCRAFGFTETDPEYQGKVLMVWWRNLGDTEITLLNVSSNLKCDVIEKENDSLAPGRENQKHNDQWLQNCILNGSELSAKLKIAYLENNQTKTTYGRLFMLNQSSNWGGVIRPHSIRSITHANIKTLI